MARASDYDISTLATEITDYANKATQGFLKTWKAYAIAGNWRALAHMPTAFRTYDDVLSDIRSALAMEGFRNDTIKGVAYIVFEAYTTARRPRPIGSVPFHSFHMTSGSEGGVEGI